MALVSERLSQGMAAIGLTSIERDVIGHVWLEPLVLAILLGAAVRTAWTPIVSWPPRSCGNCWSRWP